VTPRAREQKEAAREARRREVFEARPSRDAILAAEDFERLAAESGFVVTAVLAADCYDWFDLAVVSVGPDALAEAMRAADEFRNDPRLVHHEIVVYRGVRRDSLTEIARFGELL